MQVGRETSRQLKLSTETFLPQNQAEQPNDLLIQNTLRIKVLADAVSIFVGTDSLPVTTPSIPKIRTIEEIIFSDEDSDLGDMGEKDTDFIKIKSNKSNDDDEVAKSNCWKWILKSGLLTVTLAIIDYLNVRPALPPSTNASQELT